MGMTWYAVDWMTALIQPTRLPLHVKRAGYDFRGGRFEATLDLRDQSLTNADRAHVRALTVPGQSSIAGLRENLTSGQSTVLTDRAMGEWLITDRSWSHRDGIVELRGVAMPAYLQHVRFAANWRYYQIDPHGRAQIAIRDAMYKGQANSAEGHGVYFEPGPDITSPKRVPVQWTAGALTVWDAVEELSDAGFEWTILPDIISVSGSPTRMRRTLVIQDPVIRTPRDDVALRVTPPGSRPGVILDYAERDTITPNDYWMLGAGSGADQIFGWARYDRPVGVPRLSAASVARGALSKAALDDRAQAQLDALQKPDQAFEVVADMSLLPGGGPQLGHSHPWIVEPAWGMPGEMGRVRVVGWEWSTPVGEIEKVSLQLVREV